MFQQNLLLMYSELQQSKGSFQLANSCYDLIQGFWIDDDQKALVTKLLSNDLTTLKTATRESADQSEFSDIGITQVTRTREGIDQTEVSLFCATIISETPESIDRVERVE